MGLRHHLQAINAGEGAVQGSALRHRRDHGAAVLIVAQVVLLWHRRPVGAAAIPCTPEKWDTTSIALFHLAALWLPRVMTKGTEMFRALNASRVVATVHSEQPCRKRIRHSNKSAEA